ncbi:DUF4040 domain-containing protein [Aestuariibacter halophilus]|uniref:DUF4040 domain-containing protein n=1 Tax=Fluctibacter halophilus TaxID=226011 RepID=A0ABS8G977_9ALTE|nr:DUF4040 domain-containing protein [Aestuariibacter halophilus]MCC2616269.1 DUF4040 domain-containing protein [Aestuariibacter halophilus]
MISLVIDIVLLLFLVVMAFAILRMHHLLAVAMLFGLYSLLVAGVFTVLDAPDVAFTEAAVGTGISTVLMLATLAATRSTHERRRKGVAWMPLCICIATGALLIYGIHNMPNLGDPTAPQHTEVAKRFIESGQAETGVPNLVTAVLASYRGFDTLGEVTVVFTAGIGVMLLLVRREKPRIRGEQHDAK